MHGASTGSTLRPPHHGGTAPDNPRVGSTWRATRVVIVEISRVLEPDGTDRHPS
jgi:hypothetical protein